MSERITPLADMNDATYDFYVAPLMRRIEQLEKEKRQNRELIALIVESAGGSVSIAATQLVKDNSNLSLVRYEPPNNPDAVLVAKRRNS